MVIAFFSIILLYVVTVTVAIVNVETISSRMEAIYADQFANVQSSLRMTASLRAVGRNIAILAATEGLRRIPRPDIFYRGLPPPHNCIRRHKSQQQTPLRPL